VLKAYFVGGRAGMEPRPHARSPWAPDMLHGRLIAGLVAREAERHRDGGLQPVRLTTDLFRAAPLAPLSVEADRVRDGRRIRALDVEVTCEGRLVARASVLLAKPSEAPAGRPWSAPAWDVPSPAGLFDGEASAEALAVGSPDMRFIGPGLFEGSGPFRVWLREPCPLVEDEVLTPAVRAAMAADVANPLSNWSESGLEYINADVTTQLVRAPDGEWIGLEVTDHLDESGLAFGACRLYDERGAFGHATVTAMRQNFPPPPLPTAP
jgi:hypothetical protein